MNESGPVGGTNPRDDKAPGAPRVHNAAELHQLAQAAAARMVTGKQPLVLVVEDDPKSAKLVKLLLEAEGFRVVLASSGEEALELVRNVRPDLITLDVQLSGMDGWKFLLKLHDSTDLAAVPVVVIAGSADISMALRRGASAVLEKPLQRSELQKSLSLLGLRPDQARTRCILIVDDDHATLDQVNSYLDSPEYRVAFSPSGAAAVTDALVLVPDLIMINLMMENLGGFKVVRALQQHPTTQLIPVVVLSSAQITGEEQQTIDSDPVQPVRALNRPEFNRQALLAEIKRALD